MATEIRVPTLGESVTEATVAKWFKAVGDAVAADEPLLELETDKVTLEVNAPTAGSLTEIAAPEGSEVEVGALLGVIAEGEGAPAVKPAPAAEPEPSPAPEPTVAAPAAAPAPAAAALSPAVRKLIAEHNLDAAAISATGRGGRLVKADVLSFIEKSVAASAPAPVASVAPAAPAAAGAQYPAPPTGPREERVPMTRLRRAIAARLKIAQDTAAMLTTFNEADMGAVMAARQQYRETFQKKHGVRLGFMSFFVKALVVALGEIPAVNAEIDGDDIVYKNHYDIGVAVGTPQGLVVPVLRDADTLGFAEIETAIGDFGRRARDGKLTLDEMQGGTF
ncbi:MAG: 2-oxo acid dehydrogenase subunit E2, partial [Rhodospirillales bacterium]|nr:2-oxo acid dehydrogenase subunit E2 [Rhodospirillales bacterium]